MQVEQGYMIGSVLRGLFKDADVDVLLLLQDKIPNEIKKSSAKLQEIKKQFFPVFGKKLHITAFSLSEQEQFTVFLNNLQQKTAFILNKRM